jgi:acyl-CoA thioester hydrolase
MSLAPERLRETYRVWAQDLARFGDTDRLGHINNAAYATYLETARVALLLDPAAGFGESFVIVRLTIEFRAEMFWGGTVDIGTMVRQIGRSSFTLGHGIFKGETCHATAEAVMVRMDEVTRRAAPLSDALRERLAALE